MPLRRSARWACVALLCSLAWAPGASAAPVTVLGADGRARVVEDPFVPARADLPAPSRPARHPRVTARASARGPTVREALQALLDQGLIDDVEFGERRRAYRTARAKLHKLTGARRVELGGAIAALDQVAGDGALTASRLPELWLMLERNVRWWNTGPLLSGGRVGFEGSDLVWQHYPGRGIQLQVLGTFGKMNALWRRRVSEARLERMLDEMIEIAAERAGGLAWEYTFPYAGGRAPWVSGMAQATGLQAMSRVATRLDRQEDVFPVLAAGLAIFEQPAPHGVRIASPEGAHYLLYSFDPDLRVFNGFTQAVIGLHDFAELSGDPRAQGLYAAGEARLRAEIGGADTGAWSRYSTGRVSRESDLGYHKLLTEFLGNLCKRIGTEPYCSEFERFEAYLLEPPAVTVLSRRVRPRTVARLRYSLSKVSRVGIEVSRGGRLVLSRLVHGAPGGERYVEWSVPPRRGRYLVRITAVDLAGNVGRTEATIRVGAAGAASARP